MLKTTSHDESGGKEVATCIKTCIKRAFLVGAEVTSNRGGLLWSDQV